MAKKKKTNHTSKIKQDPFLQALVWSAVLFVYVLFGSFVVGNVLASQLIPSLFERIINNEKNAVISFYAVSQSNKLQHELFTYVEDDSALYAENVEKASRTRQERIAYYESLLAYNPYARDILYALALLYKEQENNLQADFYMMRAQAVDPSIGK